MSKNGEREVVLSSKDVVAGYLPGVDILTGCNFELYKGELVGIIGPNGAGKSTLVKSMFGLVEVRSGVVELMGEAITNLPAHQLVEKGVGFVPQTENVFPSLTVSENLEMGAYQLPKQQVEKRIQAITDLFPRLGERIRQRAGLLSGGERQMLAMGRALMMEPKVLLLDEPFSHLDEVNQSKASSLIKGLVQINGASMILSTLGSVPEIPFDQTYSL